MAKDDYIVIAVLAALSSLVVFAYSIFLPIGHLP